MLLIQSIYETGLGRRAALLAIRKYILLTNNEQQQPLSALHLK
mgnify:FL=1